MATENIVMRTEANRGPRQEAREHIRVLSHQAAKVVNVEGKSSELMERTRNEDFFDPPVRELDELLDPTIFAGRAPEQVEGPPKLNISRHLHPVKLPYWKCKPRSCVFDCWCQM